MKSVLMVFAMVVVVACSSSKSGVEECQAAGGQCRVGPPTMCPNVGPQDCRKDTTVTDPAGHYCCLPCPNGTKPNDAGTVCVERGDGG